MATVQLRNTNPLGRVDLPLIGRQGTQLDEHDQPIIEEGVGCLEAGEVFEVDEALAGHAPVLDEHGDFARDEHGEVVDAGEGLLAQVGNYELVPASGPSSKSIGDMTVPELKAYAAANEIDVAGLTAKADLQNAINTHLATNDPQGS